MNNKEFGKLLNEWKNNNKTENQLLLEFNNGLITEERLFFILEQKMIREINVLLKEGAIDKITSFIKEKVMSAIGMAKKAPKVALKLLSSLVSKASKFLNNKKVQKAIKIILIMGIIAVFFGSNEASAKVAELQDSPQIYVDAIRGMLDSLTFALDGLARDNMDIDAAKLAGEARNLISKMNSEEVKELTKSQENLLAVAKKGLQVIRDQDDGSSLLKQIVDTGNRVASYAEQAQEAGSRFTVKFTGKLPGRMGSGGDAINTVANSAAQALVKMGR